MLTKTYVTDLLGPLIFWQNCNISVTHPTLEIDTISYFSRNILWRYLIAEQIIDEDQS